MNKDIIAKRTWYYSKNDVLYNLISVMKNKEVVLLNRMNNRFCIRGLTIKNIQFLKYVLSFYKVAEEDYNIYVSVATYPPLPPQPLTLTKERKEIVNKNFDYEKPLDYDIFLDFDNDDKTILIKEVDQVLSILDRHKLMYYIIPSGSNYQIVIKNHKFLSPEECFLILANMKKKFNVTSLDLIGAGTTRKIMKCPYSLVVDVCCFPLSLLNLKDYDRFNCKEILYNEVLYNRGLYWHNRIGTSLDEYSAYLKRLGEFINKYDLLQPLERKEVNIESIKEVCINAEG